MRALALMCVIACGSSPRAGDDAARALIQRERDVWTLEGRLLAEADAALHTPKATAELGDRATAATTPALEARARAWLRTQRSAEVRTLAATVVAGLDDATRSMLAGAAAANQLTAEDVFLDYLTYDGLFDLALVRLAYKRYKANRYTGDAQALARDLLAATTAQPSAATGIQVVRATSTVLDITVFGAHLHDAVQHVRARGAYAAVEWQSSYERLRATIRGSRGGATIIEELERDGTTWRVSYASELEEYLRAGGQSPWATMLYVLGADAMADVSAGVAAAGGLEASTVVTGDPQTLPTHATLGDPSHGIEVAVLGATLVDHLGDTKPRRGRFLVVSVQLVSHLAGPLHATADWFRLATAASELPELGVSRSDLALPVAATSAPGSTLLALPYSTVEPGAQRTFALVFDVPDATTLATLLVGASELALQVSATGT